MAILENKMDKKIIRILGTKRFSAIRISRDTGLTRTTVLYRLKKLTSQRIITRSCISKRKILYSVNRKAVNRARESRIIEIFTGKDTIHAYRYFLKSPKHTFIYSIQGLDALRNIFKILPIHFVEEAHKKYKRRNIVLKGFVNKKALSIFTDMKTSLIRSHIGRTLGVKIVEGEIFLGSCELLCSPTLLLICNVKQKRAIVLKDKEVVMFFYEILSLMYHISDDISAFPLNEYLNQLTKQTIKTPVK